MAEETKNVVPSDKSLLQKVGLLVVVALLAIGGFFAYNQYIGDANKDSTKVEQDGQKEVTATLTIQTTADQPSITHEVDDLKEGETALELTKRLAEVKSSGEGGNAFVTEINRRAADQGKKEFWELLINDQQATVGAGAYVVKDGDKITWRIATY